MAVFIILHPSMPIRASFSPSSAPRRGTNRRCRADFDLGQVWTPVGQLLGRHNLARAAPDTQRAVIFLQPLAQGGSGDGLQLGSTVARIDRPPPKNSASPKVVES